MEDIREDRWRRPYRVPCTLALSLCVPAVAFLLWIVPVVDRLPHTEDNSTAGEYASDAIVVLEGDADRRPYASFLVQQGWGRDILTTRMWPHCRGLDDPPPACWTGVRNTVDEALVLQRLALDRGMRRLIIVTSRYHLLRAAAVFSIVFAGTGIELHVVAPPASALPTFQTALSELMKLIPSVAAAAAGRLAPSEYQWVMLRR